MDIVFDVDDRDFLSEKYGFTNKDLIEVAKICRSGFSIMGAAKILNKRKSRHCCKREVVV